MWIRAVSLRSERARKAYFVSLVAVACLLLVLHRPKVQAEVALPSTPVYRVQTQQRAMALTVNVVWGSEFVPNLLHALVKAHVPATFMLGGAWASAHPELVRELKGDGMELGNHGYGHRHGSLLSYQENLREIERTNMAVANITGALPKVFAPPYGEFNRTVLKASHAAGMPLVMWTIDTIDWRPSSSTTIITDRVLRRAANGAIVLMHPTDRTVEALPMILAGLKARGYRLVTISELLTLGTPMTDG